MFKLKKFFLVLLALLILFSVVCVIPVSAAPAQTIIEDAEDPFLEADTYAEQKLSGFEYGLYTVIKWKFAPLASMFKLLKPVFNTNWLLNLEEGTAGSFIAGIRGSILLLGRLFCFLYFLLSLMDSATRDSFTIEVFVKSFVKLAIIFVIFDPSTIDKIANFASAIESQLLDSVQKGIDSGVSEELIRIVDKMKRQNVFQNIGILFEHGLFSITSLISVVMVFFVAFGRAIELGVYHAMLPLGMSSIYNGGLHSSGFRYIKKCLALHIQGAIMYATMIIGHFLASSGLMINVSGLEGVFDVVVALATAMIIARSKSIANDVMGV